jgi:hypothetical protein
MFNLEYVLFFQGNIPGGNQAELQMVQPLGLINSGIQKSYMMVIPFTV